MKAMTIDLNTVIIILAVGFVLLLIAGFRRKSSSQEIDFTPCIISSPKPVVLRSIPDVTGRHITKIESGTEYFSRPADEEGWSEISEDGRNGIGFIPSRYIKK